MSHLISTLLEIPTNNLDIRAWVKRAHGHTHAHTHWVTVCDPTYTLEV